MLWKAGKRSVIHLMVLEQIVGFYARKRLKEIEESGILDKEIEKQLKEREDGDD